MQIKIGKYDVLEQGTVIGIENEPIDFLIAEEIGFIIRIIFKKDSNNESPTIKAEQFEKAGALLTFNNFDNSLGMGHVEPIKIGTLNNRELLLNYRIHSLDMGGKTLHFTWLLGEEVKHE